MFFRFRLSFFRLRPKKAWWSKSDWVWEQGGWTHRSWDVRSLGLSTTDRKKIDDRSGELERRRGRTKWSWSLAERYAIGDRAHRLWRFAVHSRSGHSVDSIAKKLTEESVRDWGSHFCLKVYDFLEVGLAGTLRQAWIVWRERTQARWHRLRLA